MSERGSFVTQFVYCHKCFESLKPILALNGKFLRGVVIPRWDGPLSARGDIELPIIAGKIGDTYPGGERITLGVQMRKEIETAICHQVMIALIPDGAEESVTLLFSPRGNLVSGGIDAAMKGEENETQ